MSARVSARNAAAIVGFAWLSAACSPTRPEAPATLARDPPRGSATREQHPGGDTPVSEKNPISVSEPIWYGETPDSPKRLETPGLNFNARSAEGPEGPTAALLAQYRV